MASPDGLAPPLTAGLPDFIDHPRQPGVAHMRFILMALSVALLASSPAGAAVADDADNDTTSVAQCEELPHSVSVREMAWSDTTAICREMMRVMDGVRHKDITQLEKLVSMLQRQGYKKENIQVAKEMVEIIRLRGLYDKPDRWLGTYNVIYKSWAAFHGVVGPGQVVSFLRAAGPDAAKGLSDDGLTTMIILMKQVYQSGG
jgi:hypothetical protein